MDKVWLQAPRGWINDPNGFCYYKGKYHLFYQHFPYAPEWGRMHWGHAVSEDLVVWRHLEIALYPSKTEDADGCFSGSAIEDENGNLVLTYTGVRYEVPDPENTNVGRGNVPAAQLRVVSSDGVTFDNIRNKEVVLPTFADDSIACPYDVRDPKVFSVKNGYRMVLGTKKNGAGRLLVYKSNDLKAWTLAFAAEHGGFGTMWECPDLFEIDGQWFLLFSPMGLPTGSQSVCVKAEFDEDSCNLSLADEFSYFDYGMDLYAPQTTTDEQGRRIVVAWLRMPRSADGKTRGMFCLPRVCVCRNGKLAYLPHPHITQAFSQPVSSLKEAADGKARLVTTLQEGESLTVGGYRISRQGNCVIGDRQAVLQGCDGIRTTASTPPLSQPEKLEIYLHPNLIEIYASDGEAVLSHAVYGLSDELIAPHAVQIFALPNAAEKEKSEKENRTN